VTRSRQADPVSEPERRPVRAERPRPERGHELPDARGSRRRRGGATDAPAVEVDDPPLEARCLRRHEENALAGRDRKPGCAAGKPHALCVHA
jgi:hypothetical protein